MKKLLRTAAAALFCVCSGFTPQARAWQSDNGNGTFTNPVLNADYPDPDITRVGNDFYMVSTTFVNSPGIKVLRSSDLVNWELVGHAASTLDGGNLYNMIGGTAYRQGMWASSIRYRNGTFYVAVQPSFSAGRIYYATNPAGPWSYYQLDRGIYDPGLFFDDNGTGYIVCGHGPQSVMQLNANYSAIVSQVDNVINSGGEGSHLVKANGYYYLFNANPGVWPFQLRCSRATNIYGPWETGRVCLTATTGGHQGAIVDAPDGSWWGFVHNDLAAIGRVPRICPIFWENNWPVFGTSAARDQVPLTYTKPVQGSALKQPATSDEFSAGTLGLQWNWNHNPDNTRWSLTERAGYLRLRPTQSTRFWTARNTLTQKGQGPTSRGDVRLELGNLQNGDTVGFGTLGKVNGHITVTRSGSNLLLSMKVITVTDPDETVDTRVTNLTVTGTTIYLRTDLNFLSERGSCFYSTDGVNWTNLGGDFDIIYSLDSTFQGTQFAIFCYNASADSTGYADVDWFHYNANPATQPFTGTYRIISRLSGKAIDAVGTADGAQIGQWPYWGGNNQRWTVTHLGNGEYSIINVQAPTKGLDIAWGGTNNGAVVQLWPYWGGPMQRFTFTSTDSGYYRVTPVSSPSSCLDVKDISTADGALIQQWTYWGGTGQQWILLKP